MAIDRSQFAKACVDATAYCGVFSYLHYVIAIAQLRSKISDTNDADEIGPFRLVQKDWDAYKSNSDFEYNYLSTDINLWFMQCHIVALMVYRTQQRLFNSLNRNPSAVELYQDQWPQTDPAALVANLSDALSGTGDLLAPAAKSYFGQDIPVVQLSDPQEPPQAGASGKINFNKVPNGATGKKLANLILNDFSIAGFDFDHQVAALANAIANQTSSRLPTPEEMRTAFVSSQLNRIGGLGKGHSPDGLVDPEQNTQIVIGAAQNAKAFARATTLEDAISAF